MKEYIKDRVLDCADYIIFHRCTIRQAADVLGYCKSAVYNDMAFRLPLLDIERFNTVQEIFNENKEVACVRGGHATKGIVRPLCEEDKQKMLILAQEIAKGKRIPELLETCEYSRFKITNFVHKHLENIDKELYEKVIAKLKNN